MAVTAPATDAGRDEPAVCGFDSRLLVAHKNGQGGVGGKAVFSGSLRETKHGFAGFGRDAGFRVLRQGDAASVKELDSGGSGMGRNDVSGGHWPRGDARYRDAEAIQIERLGTGDGA
jgi:hypothetical protein